MSDPQLILASTSSARRTMLAQAGVAFTAIASEVDEAALKADFAGPPEALAAALAQAKAQAVAAAHPHALVIGADQILLQGTKIYDKPRDLNEAAAQLRALAGRTHRLISAVCLLHAGAPWFHVEHTLLEMRDISEAFLADYLDREGETILHCVGAYRLEGLGAQLFTRVEGDYFTVLGMPLLPLLGALRAAGALAA